MLERPQTHDFVTAGTRGKRHRRSLDDISIEVNNGSSHNSIMGRDSMDCIEPRTGDIIKLKTSCSSSNSSGSSLLKRNSSTYLPHTPSSKEIKYSDENKVETPMNSSSLISSSQREISVPLKKVNVSFKEAPNGLITMSLMCSQNSSSTNDSHNETINGKILVTVRSFRNSLGQSYDPSKMVQLVDGQVMEFSFNKQIVDKSQIKHALVFRISSKFNKNADYISHDITESLFARKSFVLNVLPCKSALILDSSKQYVASTPKKDNKPVKPISKFQIGPFTGFKSFEEFGLVLSEGPPVRILDILEDSVADKSRKFAIGDAFLEIDGKNVKFSTKDTVASLLCSMKGMVNFTLFKSPGRRKQRIVLKPIKAHARESSTNEVNISQSTNNSEKSISENMPIIANNLDPLIELNQMYNANCLTNSREVQDQENNSMEESFSQKDAVIKRLMFETYYELYEYCAEFEKCQANFFDKMPAEIMKPIKSYLKYFGKHAKAQAQSFFKYVMHLSAKDEDCDNICVGCFLKNELYSSSNAWVSKLLKYWNLLFKVFASIEKEKSQNLELISIIEKFKIIDYMTMPIIQFKVFHRSLHSISCMIPDSSICFCTHEKNHALVEEMLNRMSEAQKTFAQWESDLDRFARQVEPFNPDCSNMANNSTTETPQTFTNDKLDELKSHLIWGGNDLTLRNYFNEKFQGFLLTNDAQIQYNNNSKSTKVFLLLTNECLLVTVKESSLKMAVVDVIPKAHIGNLTADCANRILLFSYVSLDRKSKRVNLSFKSKRNVADWQKALSQ